MSIVKNFLPIINFNFGEQDLLDLATKKQVYFSAIEVLSQYFNCLELSLVSYDIWQFLPELIDLTKKNNLEPSFGSCTSLESAKLLDQKITNNNVITKVFAPAFNIEVNDFFSSKPHWDYIPGVFNLEQIIEPIRVKKNLKIFPYSFTDSKSFLKRLSKPFSELNKQINRQRILSANEELLDQYQIQSKIEIEGDTKVIISKSGHRIYVIDSPLAYQNIRNSFLFDQKTKLLIKPDFTNKITDLKSLTKDFDKLYVTGVKISDIEETDKKIIYASSIFNNIILDLLAGHIKTQELGDLMKGEIENKFFSKWV